ncbi:MAG: hypothetical protein MI861_20400, partial [Pirellulales bacterium]|nr:hypothetical protein [Pirellulales bacterium]
MRRIHPSIVLYRIFLFPFAITLMTFFFGMMASPAAGQSGLGGRAGTLGGVEPAGTYPPESYFLAWELYRSGDLEQAIELLDRVPTRRDINGRWLDSIPVLALQAECYWQLGNLAAVQEHLDLAFRIAIRYRGWLSNVEWSSAIQPNVQVAQRSGLWPAAAAIRQAPVSDRVSFQSGRRLNARVLLEGGAVEEFNVRTMDIAEIMRGLAIASYRRRILLGPLTEQDPLASQLLDATKYPVGARLPVTQALIGSMRAVEQFSNRDDKQAVSIANQNAMLGGAAHPLTPIALLAQASALAGSDQPTDAVSVAATVANTAAALGQPEWVGESVQLAAGCARTPEQAESVRQFATTAATALHRDSRLAALQCLVGGADASITAGNLEAAATLMTQAQALSGRRGVWQPRIDAYAAYVAARLAAARGESVGIGRMTDVDKALNQMTAFSLNRRIRNRPVISMPRIYQLGLIHQAAGQTLGGKSGDKLLQAYADDPPGEVWRRDAVDALSAAMMDRMSTHRARVEIAASKGYGEELLKRVDGLLAARFQQSLPLGSRIAQLRLIARANEQVLNEELVEFRK